jgi:hypothetical protein
MNYLYSLSKENLSLLENCIYVFLSNPVLLLHGTDIITYRNDVTVTKSLR